MPTTEITTAAANGDVPVASLEARRRQRRLVRLLDVHARLARMSLEHRAHGLAEQAQELFTQQLAVEDVLAEEFHGTYHERLPDWVTQEVEFTDHRDRVDPTCSICRPGAGATATPEAA